MAGSKLMEIGEVRAAPRRVSAQTRTALGVQVSGPVPEGGGGPVGVGRRRVGAGHVHVMHAGQEKAEREKLHHKSETESSQNSTRSTKRAAQPNRFEQETTEGTESELERGEDTDESAADLNRS